MDTGWIKLYRKMDKWEWAGDPVVLALFIHLLLAANFEDRNWRGIVIKRGDVLFGRKEWSKKTGISEQSLRTALTKLKSTNEVTIKSTSKYSIVSIQNYNQHQDINQQTNQRLTSNQPATNHIIRIEEGKNEKKHTTASAKKFQTTETLTDDVLQEISQAYGVGLWDVQKERESLRLYVESTGKKYANYKATLMAWVRRKIDEGKIKSHSPQTKKTRLFDLVKE